MLAREVHDELIQDLIAIKYQLDTLSGDARQGAERLAAVRNNIRALIDALRHICTDLRPPTFDSLGLGAALQSYACDWSARTGIAVYLEVEPGWGRLSEMAELSIFRMVQEGLSNVRRHARARSVHVGLRHASSGAWVISVMDDGCGISCDTDPDTLAAMGHFGLLGIRERAELLDGRMRVQNQPHGGVALQIEIPA